MAHVVTENCIACKYTTCVESCPVDCFYEGSNFLVIHPDECIDCGYCVPECPADAIIHEDELSEHQREYVELNQQLSEHWPLISRQKKPLADADLMNGVKHKRLLLKL